MIVQKKAQKKSFCYFRNEVSDFRISLVNFREFLEPKNNDICP